MPDIQESKDKMLSMLSRLVPGTTRIDNCRHLELCIDAQTRKCENIKNICISCIEGGDIIGGVAFIFDLKLGENLGNKRPLLIYRFGQSDSYMTAIEGKGFDDLIGKFEKDPEIKRITERTQFIKDEKKEFEDSAKIDAFKRSKADVLIVRRNKQGEYEKVDKRLIDIAKEKEKEIGVKIRIIDESEIVRNVYLLGICSKELVERLEVEIDTMDGIDNTMFILVRRASRDSKYKGVLAINSMKDDVIGNNVEKDRMKKYFMDKYDKELTFMCADTFQTK